MDRPDQRFRTGFQLGDWKVHPDRCAIEGAAGFVHVEPKLIEVLRYLAIHRGEVVRREQLIEDVWCTVVNDEVLSRAVSLLRSHLGDDPKSPRYIETVPKVGYRLVADVGVHETRQPLAALAVLPFQDLSEERGFLGDSVTDELILSLSKLTGIKVVARRSVHALPEELRDVRAIGRHFDVDAILEGTVKRYGDRLRITVQLANSRDGFVQWSHAWDEPLGDVFALQRTVVGAICAQLQLISSGGQVQPGTPATEPRLEAYQLFLNARYLIKLRGHGPLRRSIEMFEQAVAIDPRFGRAQVALAQAIALLPLYDPTVAEEPSYERALQRLDASVLQDVADCAEAESIRGFVADRRWQWLQARMHHRRALELNPGNPNAWNWYSAHLAAVGHCHDAMEAARRGKDLDDVAAVLVHRLAVTQLWIGDDIRAAENFAAGAQFGFSGDASFGQVVFLHRMQRWDEMQRLFTRIVERYAYDAGWVEALFRFYRGNGSRDQAIAACEAALAAGQFPLRAELTTWIYFGDMDRSYAALQRPRPEKRYLDIEFLWAREATAVREDARFPALTAALGLDEYWAQFGKADCAG